jgi:hypothetical protein
MKKNKIKNIFKKTIYVFLLTGMLFLNSYSATLALFGIDTSAPSPEEIMDAVEQRYGFDPDILRRSQKKADYPQVEVFFNNTSPKTGEKVTATALPKYFKNNNEDLYYTWMLFREGDDLDDDEVVEKAKVRAMGLVARGDFDPFLFKTDYPTNSNDDLDKDGYDASYGGDDGRGGREGTDYASGHNGFESDHYIAPQTKQLVDTSQISRCYRHNFGISNPNDYSSAVTGKSGRDLIVNCEHKFPEAPEGQKFENPINPDEELECDDDYEVGDGEFTTAEELCWKLDPENYDTDGDGYPDEADLAGLGQIQLTWTYQEGDRIGLIVEGMSMMVINEVSAQNDTTIELITYGCMGKPDEMYCVDSNYNIGECLNGTCVTDNDCQQLQDDGKPCSTGGVSIGVCNMDNISGIEGFGTCEYVLPCTSASSSDGDLCQKNQIVGTCFDEECIISRCGEVGDKCQTDTGKIGFCSSNGDCEENATDFDDPSMNPYYKITWAGMDICDKEQIEGDDKRKLIKNDECEDDSDYGYTYLATKKVSQAQEGLLKTELRFSPEEPQANENNPEYSNYIKVKADFTENDIKSDFVYYKWDIFICTEDEIVAETCARDDSNKITATCSGGENLGSCTEGNLQSNSLNEGMGIQEIEFRGSADFYREEVFNDIEKKYFKVYLETKERADNDIERYLSSINIPITRNDIDVSFYQINFNGNEGESTFSEEICVASDGEWYEEICPVYTSQILVAAYNDSEGNIEEGYWELNGEKINLPATNPFSTLPFGSLGDFYTYLPITSSGQDLNKVSFKALTTTSGEQITSERLISAEEPMIKAINANNEAVWHQTFNNSEGVEVVSDNVLWSTIGEEIELKTELVPSYLENNLEKNNINIKWYLNGQEINTYFIDKNPDYTISFDAQNQIIRITLNGEEGDSVNLKAEIVKNLNNDEKNFFEEKWNIKNFGRLEHSKLVTIKQTKSISPSSASIVSGNSLNLFMASTYKNAPEYFVFIIKTAIILILFWSLFYSFNHWSSREYKLEK